MSDARKYYITTPIYYVNDSPHIGHAYTTLACDVLARFMRLDGYDVMFLTGTDEHGQKVEKSARAAGMEPQPFTDKVSQNFRDLANAMGISNDQFIRTTEKRHYAASQAIWKAIAASKSPKGRENIYLGKYAGWYAVRDEAFYGEDELTAGPDGKKRAPSGAEVEWVEEPSYFFRLSDWQETLIEYYEANPDFIGPASRRNEVLSFVRRGLEDLSISRTTFGWGVPVPDAPGHIMYVWLDALTNYITAVGYPDTKSKAFQAFWPADLHMVGKDILRFHAVYWPAFLMAAGLEVQKRVFAHGWWTAEGQKMSKSLGNVIEPNQAIAKYGLDPLRYFLLRELPFGQDGDFSHRAMVSRINSDLANDFGNLAQRVLSFVAKNAEAKVPAHGAFTEADKKLLGDAAKMIDGVRAMITKDQAFYEALGLIWQVVRQGNGYIDEQAPWALRKTDPARMTTVLYVLCETLRRLAIVVQPFMPDSMAKLLDQLAVPANLRDYAALERTLVPGTALP
ncbi:MAG: methionine--tRNA ligase, partial [Alphaproteobacteria bacterium]